MLTKATAYEKWLGIKADHQPPTLYRLLAIDAFESDKEIISNAADSRIGFVRQFQIGENSSLAAEILNELARAQVILLNPQKKAEYDTKLQSAQASRSGKSMTHKASLSGLQITPGQPVVAAKPIPKALPLERKPPPLPSVESSESEVDIGSLVSNAGGTSSIVRRKQPRSLRKPMSPIVAMSAVGALAAGCVVAGLVYLYATKRQSSIANAANVGSLTDPPSVVPAAPAGTGQAKTSVTSGASGSAALVKSGSSTPAVGPPAVPSAPIVEHERPYDAERLAKDFAALKERSKAVKTPDDSRSVAEKAIILVDRAIVLGKPDTAKEVAALTLATARSADALPLMKRATLLVIQLSSLQPDVLKPIAQKRLDGLIGEDSIASEREPIPTGPSLRTEDSDQIAGTHDARWGKTEAERRKIFFDLLKAVDDFGMTPAGKQAWKDIQTRNGIDIRVTLGILNEGFGTFANWEQPDGGGKASSRMNRMEWIAARTRSMSEPMLN